MSKYFKKGKATCPVCGQEFKHRGAMMGHLKFKHPEQSIPKPTTYKDIDPDIEDAKYRMKQAKLYDKNIKTKKKIYNFIHTNSLSV